MKTLIIVILILMTTFCFAGFKFEDWQKDKWSSEQGSFLKYDKAEHLILAVGLESGLHYVLTPKFKKYSPLITIAVGAGWEVRDGFVLQQGFSWKDLIADAGGVVVSMVLRKIF